MKAKQTPEALSPEEAEAKALRLLGLARRAGKLSPGLDATMSQLAKGQVLLVCLAADTGDSTRRKILRAAETHNCPVHCFSNADRFGEATGSGSRAVIGVLDAGFASGLAQITEIWQMRRNTEKQV